MAEEWTFPSSWPSSLSVEADSPRSDVTQTPGAWGAGVFGRTKHIAGQNTPGVGELLCYHIVGLSWSDRATLVGIQFVQRALVPGLQSSLSGNVPRRLFQDLQDSRKNFCVESFL